MAFTVALVALQVVLAGLKLGSVISLDWKIVLVPTYLVVALQLLVYFGLKRWSQN